MDDLEDDLDPSLFLAPEYEEIKKDVPKNPPTHHKVDRDSLSTYIYPTNLQVRDYQYNIVNRALFHNLLVALPTGLGKTFIASTVMLNYLRWFPDLKIIFMAPTKPLVAQQIKACCGITGIPTLKVAILLDKVRKNRATIWEEKQVFFTTPQVVENDLATGIVEPKLIVLLVVDEAHRAKGNYAYNNVVKFLNRFNPSYRILALTATPASDVDGVQEIVSNLNISKVEVRTERSIDIFKYLKQKKIERISVGQSNEIREAIDLICVAIAPILETANQRKIYEITDPSKVNAFTALDAQQKLIRNPNIPEGLKWANYFILQLLVVVGQCLRRLNIYGIRSFYSYFHEKHLEFTTKYNNKKSTNKLAASFYSHSSIKILLERSESMIKDRHFLGHPKLEVVISELTSFFENTSNEDSRVIIFTEFRESALDIVNAIELLESQLKAHIFIGQAKEKERFDEDKFLKKGKKKKKDEVKEKPVKPEKGAQTSSEMAQLTGMNQKMQKDLIKKFKSGVYNILVATSIGEEGLDIGEVDLIVCFDSTSSPIKNVQRMGRTGRNRDGKVLLLFSSNEESKFDKAMSGYEYIQQHIMNGNMIELHDQNRIIPADYTPTVEERFIDIPEENLELKEVDDEDEIIKIATKYMTGSKSKSKAKLKKQQKIEKKFFMPDDAETGFKLVSMMLKRKDETVSVGEKRRREEESRPRDFLDSLLDSDEDDLMIDDTSKLISSTNRSECDTSSKNDILECGSDISSREATKTSAPTKVNAKNPSAKVLRQPTLDLVREAPKKVATTLGPKRRVPNVLDQLKAAQSSSAPKAKLEEDFDDDDDEILELARKSSSFTSQSARIDSIYELGENDGLLTNEQKSELYMSYYVPAEAFELRDCYIPAKKPQDQEGHIPHGRVALSLLDVHAFMSTITNRESANAFAANKALHLIDPPLDNLIEFE